MTTETINDGNNEFSLNESARDIWLAGLGAFARTREQGGKLYAGLVKEGEKFQQETRKGFNEKVVGLRDQVVSGVKSARTNASGSIVKLENLFDDRVARVLGRFGIPTAADLQRLSDQVGTLSDEVKKLGHTEIKADQKAA